MRLHGTGSRRTCNRFSNHPVCPDMETDEELVARVLAGDRNAFRHLIARYERLVAHVVSRLVRDDADREEVCQDVFLRVYRGVGHFRFGSKLSTWIARIAHRASLNHLEKKRLPLCEDLPDAEQARLQPTSAAPDPLEDAVAEEARRFVRQAVHALPAAYRTVVTLHYLEEMTVSEVGDVMNLPAGTVKSHLFRARRLLKDALLERYSGKELGR
jgi:RNA polymerase sigma-70 factor (ECF subfamily)